MRLLHHGNEFLSVCSFRINTRKVNLWFRKALWPFSNNFVTIRKHFVIEIKKNETITTYRPKMKEPLVPNWAAAVVLPGGVSVFAAGGF
jgi:hypothetical protein